MIPLECLFCGNTHHRPKNVILRILNGNLQETNKGCYCSDKCKHDSRNTSKWVECKNCHTKFKKQLADCKKTKNDFCSSSCSATYNNTHKTTGYRRSKLEMWLETQLIKSYPNLEIHFNRVDSINAELDIYIPSLKLAFELNGIFHYEPIYSEEKLKKTQNNDKRKFQACLEKQIELCIIDVSKIKYFKENTSIPILEIIKPIIDKKWSSQ